ncbi:MAG: hypothetical protein U1E29_18240 [Coriobacteriia bacterium]|nr:hypothetical protein [Coriobacteriia bacterium]
MDWTALFGENDSMTIEQMESATKGMKLVDLSDGGYVGKEKFDKEVERLKALVTDTQKELVDLKAASDGDDGLKKQLATLEAQLEAETARREAAEKQAESAVSDKTGLERLTTVSGKVADARFARFVRSEVEALVTDDVDFDTALDKWLADNPDYAPGEGKEPPAKLTTGVATKGAPAEDYKAAVDSVFDDGKKKE